MTTLIQIVLGTLLLTACALTHVVVVASGLPLLKRCARWFRRSQMRFLRTPGLLSVSVFVIVFAHTVQIWIWAVAFLAIGAMVDLGEAIYFSTVTYTTLGYGDIVLDSDHRIVATFAAITGLLTFGISTALLIAILGHIMPKVFSDDV